MASSWCYQARCLHVDYHRKDLMYSRMVMTVVNSLVHSASCRSFLKVEEAYIVVGLRVNPRSRSSSAEGMPAVRT